MTNRNDLVNSMSESVGLPKATVNKVLDSFVEAITSSLKSGEEVRLVGFGTFSLLHRKAMEGRNPRTGKPIKIKASKRPKFRAGKQLVEAVN